MKRIPDIWFLFPSYEDECSHGRRGNAEAPGQGEARPQRAKRAENFQRLEINYRRLPLVYVMRRPRPRSIGSYVAPGTLRGNFPPDPSRLS